MLELVSFAKGRPFMKNLVRYDIVFLRCLAVLAVVCYHFQFPVFRDGYAGVDVFFVLSGFLMTRIILKERAIGGSFLLDFYYRRLARIVPALLGMLLFFFALVYLLLGIKLYDYSRFALSSSLFVSNIYYYLASGYFAPSSQLNILLHTWSLSLEMQFYISYPLLLLVFRYLVRQNGRYDRHFLYVLLLLSLATMLFFVGHDQSFAFYIYPMRAWEFFAGGLAFCHADHIRKWIPQVYRNALGLVFLIILLLSLSGALAIGKLGWPSPLTLVPVVASVGLLLMQCDFRWFRSGVVTYIARISYSWYLWHWPMVVLSSYLTWNATPWQRVLIFALSLLLSNAAYYLVEFQPLYRKPRSLLLATLFIVVVTAGATQISLEQYLPSYVDRPLMKFQRRYPVDRAPDQYQFGNGHLLANSAFSTFDTTALYQTSDSTRNFLLLGDCHAGMFSATLRKLAQKHHVNLIQATADEAFPAPGAKSVYKGPEALMHYIYEDYLPAEAHKIDQVILVANYAGYSKRELVRYMHEIDHFFSGTNTTFIYIGQTESYKVEFPTIAFLEKSLPIDREQYLEPARYYANKFLKASTNGDRYIEVYNLPSITHASNGQAYLYDADHFSTFGTDQYADLLEKRIFRGEE